MPEINNNEFKPKAKGTPRGSRNEKIYESGLIPASHLNLLKGIKIALGEDTQGEIIFQRVLDLVKMHRASALKVVKYLEKYGYLKYEPNPKEHRVYVEILKNKEIDNNVNNNNNNNNSR